MDKDLLLTMYACGVVTGIFVIEPLVNILYILLKKLFSKWSDKNV